MIEVIESVHFHESVNVSLRGERPARRIFMNVALKFAVIRQPLVLRHHSA
jgi:hypothetical protein